MVLRYEEVTSDGGNRFPIFLIGEAFGLRLCHHSEKLHAALHEIVRLRFAYGRISPLFWLGRGDYNYPQCWDLLPHKSSESVPRIVRLENPQHRI